MAFTSSRLWAGVHEGVSESLVGGEAEVCFFCDFFFDGLGDFFKVTGVGTFGVRFYVCRECAFMLSLSSFIASKEKVSVFRLLLHKLCVWSLLEYFFFSLMSKLCSYGAFS